MEKIINKLLLPSIFTNENQSQNPELWEERRKEIAEILQRLQYGFLPPTYPVSAEEISSKTEFAGKAIMKQIKINVNTDKGIFSFPISFILPKNVKNPPVFLHIAFRSDIPDKYMPAEEIIDNGFAVVTMKYIDISSDNGDCDGIYNYFEHDKDVGFGKIALWAYAASRTMDYLQTLDYIDKNKIAVIGHSRLGKTALLCGALDTRFSMVISNDSGCSGAALFRDKEGENIEVITRVFPFWFCGNFNLYKQKENSLPFDQHFLLSLIAPRHLYVGSAAEDLWADPKAEFLAAYEASKAYKVYGLKGLECDSFPENDKPLHEGNIGYHNRSGSHYLSRSDWNYYMQYRKKHNV